MKRFNTRLFGRLLPIVGAVALVATVMTMGASAAAPPYPYANGFEAAEDAGELGAATDQAMFHVNRVPTGTDGITSASGAWHAVAPVATDEVNTFTRYGGYSNSFPATGYTTSADIYIDTAAPADDVDLRFDWSSATSNATRAVATEGTSSSTSARTATPSS